MKLKQMKWGKHITFVMAFLKKKKITFARYPKSVKLFVKLV